MEKRGMSQETMLVTSTTSQSHQHNMRIFKKEIDIADKQRVWVEITPGELMMLKFEESKTDADYLAEAQRIIDERNKVVEVSEEELEKDLTNYIEQKYETS